MGAQWAAPPAPPALGPDELHIWRASLVAPAETVQRLHASLSPDEAARAARFVFPHDRDRFVLARWYLRKILGSYLGLPPASLQFAYTAFGKPLLAGPPGGPQLSFNLSHSGDLALYAVTLGRQVGVDIERVRLDLQLETVVAGIFTAREQTALAALPGAQRRLAFFNGWVRKEAYLKARGEGLAYPPDSFEVSMLPGEPLWLSLAAQAGGGPWRVYALDPGGGYVAAVVAEGAGVALRLYAAVA